MPKYCPTCASEYTDKITSCPTCKETLVNKKPKASKDFFVDFYAAADEIEAERLIAYLESIGIAGQEAVAGMSQIPAVSDTRFIVSVPKTMLKQAREAVEQARRDHIISQDGLFL
jgi:hypothetical protein